MKGETIKSIGTILIVTPLIFLLEGLTTTDNMLWDNIEWYCYLAVVIIVVGVICLIKGNKKEQKEFEENHEKYLNNLRVKEEEFRNRKDEFVKEYGEPDRTISFGENDINKIIWFYQKARKLFIYGEEYKFEEILSCDISDKTTKKEGMITTTTSTKTGGMLGRAAVGGLVAGVPGALLGGATGKKQSESKIIPGVTIHDYSILININRISKPILKIYTGDRESKAQEIWGALNVIIAQNQKN